MRMWITRRVSKNSDSWAALPKDFDSAGVRCSPIISNSSLGDADPERTGRTLFQDSLDTGEIAFLLFQTGLPRWHREPPDNVGGVRNVVLLRSLEWEDPLEEGM